MKDITGTKKFWKTIKFLFSNKKTPATSITLKRNRKTVENQNEVVNSLNDYFWNVVSSFDIPESNNINTQSESMSCSALKSIMKYRIHPSITAIQDAYQGNFFYCSTLAIFDIISEMKNLNKKKAIHINLFPFLKMANITPVFKKGSKSNRKNFKPIRILPVLSKSFWEVIKWTIIYFLPKCPLQIPMWIQKRF